MNKVKLGIAILVGLMVGQLFAEGERPFKVANTVRAGYNDNLYYTSKDEEKSFFVTDTIDLSFRAALSDRTDVTLKSQINLLTDDGSNELYPNLYALLNQSVSPRLLLRLSEYYRSGDKAGTGKTAATAGQAVRYNYFQNAVDASADYVLTGKDRLGASLNQGILRNDKEIDELDYTTVGAGASWKRELSPQRTYATLNLRRSRVDYDNRPKNTTVTNGTDTLAVEYLDAKAFYNSTDLSVELSHTFNQEWQGRVEVGATYVEPNFSDSWSELGNTNNSSIAKTTNRVDNSSQLQPLLGAGLVYSPSPRTRLTGDLSLTHKPSDDSGYGGQNTAELRFGAQHNITAKLMAKATARFANTKYDAQDATSNARTENTDNRMGLDLRFTYKLNRINSLALGLTHNENSRDSGEDWKQNTVDVGWRVELN